MKPNDKSTPKKRGPGRPEHKPTRELRKMVQGMAYACIPPEVIARVIKVNETTLRKHYAPQIDGAKERLLGKAAKTLATRLESDDLGAACFVMKTQGKPYGWTERHEVTGKDGVPLFDLSRLSDDELAAYENLVRKGSQPGADPGRADATRH